MVILGFDYDFNAIGGEPNELFSAYKEMFEVTLALGNPARNFLRIYFPFVDSIFVNTYTLLPLLTLTPSCLA
jgi:hypothetical protein